jgi:hypothetical protein
MWTVDSYMSNPIESRAAIEFNYVESRALLRAKERNDMAFDSTPISIERARFLRALTFAQDQSLFSGPPDASRTAL